MFFSAEENSFLSLLMILKMHRHVYQALEIVGVQIIILVHGVVSVSLIIIGG